MKSTPTNQAPAKLYAALAKAQAGFAPIIKDRPGQTGNQKFKYANLAQLIEATRPALAANGLAVIQLINTNEQGKHVISTLLTHESGECVQSCVVMAAGSIDKIQDYGKAVTYMRRYAYSAILCLASDEEPDADDGDDDYRLLESTEPSEPRYEAPREVKPDEPPPLPEYPQAAFDKRFESRKAAILSGERTIEETIDMIQTKAMLTAEQRATLEAIGAPQA